MSSSRGLGDRAHASTSHPGKRRLARLCKYAWPLCWLPACVVTKPRVASLFNSSPPSVPPGSAASAGSPSASRSAEAPVSPPSAAASRALLPPAPAEPLPYVINAVPLPMAVARVVSIHGTDPRNVWMLVETPNQGADWPSPHLLHSDGRQTRLVHRDLCRNRGQGFAGRFDLVRAAPQQVTMYGVSLGGLTFGNIVRSVRGRLHCPDQTGLDPESFFGMADPAWFFESAGQVWSMSAGGITGITTTARTDAVDCSVHDQAGVVAIQADATHGWFVGGRRLLEWTGLRWRPRNDALPVGTDPQDLLALAAAEGSVWAVTQGALLRASGARFVRESVPEKFAAKALVAVSAKEVWAFGTGMVYRLRDTQWYVMQVPIAAGAAWRAPNGELWLAGELLDESRGLEAAAPTLAAPPSVQVLRLAPKAPPETRP